MDGSVNDIFTLPLVLPSTNLNQSVSLINCNGWQLELAKDQSAVPFVIVENSDFSIRNVSGQPGNTETNVMPVIDNHASTGPFQNEISTKAKKSECTNIENKNEVGKAISENCLMEDLVETLIMYKCKLCNFKAVEKSLLASHIKDVHLKVDGLKKNSLPYTEGVNATEENDGSEDTFEMMVYMCGSCTEAFGSFAECRVHMSQHHKIVMGSKAKPAAEKEMKEKERELLIKVNVATDDVKLIDNKGGAKDHLLQSDVNKERNIKCPESGCPIKFSSQLGLARHKLCHYSDSSKGYFCSYCNTSFTKWSMCANHLWRIHSVDAELYSCTFCKYKTAVRVKMKAHEKIHDDGKEFMCMECGKMFSQRVQLRNHEVIHTKLKPEQQPRWYTKKECDQCQKTFANSKTLKKHVQAVHSKLKPYVCQVCGHCSATKEMLQTHLRQHTGEKPFSCPTCPFTTGDHNSLRRHRMRHSGERPYQCPHCPYSSIQSKSLQHHVATWHQNVTNTNEEAKERETFKCMECSYSTDCQDSWLQHHTLEHPSPKNLASSSLDSECLLYGDVTATQIVYQCLQGYKENKSDQADLICSTSLDTLSPENQVKVAEETKNTFQSVDQTRITIPYNQQGLKDIEIAMNEEGLNYLPEHSLETNDISLPSADIDTY